MFFFISGYLIFLTLTNSKSQNFLIHRYFRLVPSLIIVLLILSFINKEFWLKDFLLGSIFIGDFCGNRGVLGIDMWTLHTETRFYILIFFIYLLFLRSNLKSKSMLALSYFTSICVIFGILYLLHINNEGFDFFDPKWNIYCILYLFFGIFLYLFHDNIINKYEFISACIANTILIIFIRHEYFKLSFKVSIEDNYLLGCLVSLILIRFKNHIPNARIISLVAFISYPVYLIHHPMINKWGLVSLIPIFTISYIISMLVEHPAMVWIRKKC